MDHMSVKWVQFRARSLTLSALRCVTRTTCGSLSSFTVLVTSSFTGMIRPPTCAAHPSPSTRLHKILPLVESSPNILPASVAATMILRKPKSSRDSGFDAFVLAGSTREVAEA